MWMGNDANLSALSEEIKGKAEDIAAILASGKHVELLQNIDGLRIIAMERKVVK